MSESKVVWKQHMGIGWHRFQLRGFVLPMLLLSPSGGYFWHEQDESHDLITYHLRIFMTGEPIEGGVVEHIASTVNSSGVVGHLYRRFE